MIDNIVKEVPIERLKAIIFFSSIDIYGFVDDLDNINEETPQRLVGYYGLSKLASEHILRKNFGVIPITILRLPGIYGYGDNYKSTIGKFIKDSLNKGDVTIINDGHELRDYVEINDLCKIVNHFIVNPFNGPVVVASGKSIKVREIVNIITNLIDNNIAIKSVKTDSPGSDLIFNNNLIRSIMPSFTFTELKTGISKYLKKTNLLIQ